MNGVNKGKRRKKLYCLLVAMALSFPASVLAGQSRPLSLSDAVSLATSDNPTIKNACDVVTGTRYGLDIAQSEFGFRFAPQATSGLGTSVDTAQNTTLNLSKKFSTGTAVELSSGTSSSDKGFYRSFTGITVSQSLFRFGSLANTNNLAEAKRRISTAERQVELTKEQVVMDVITAFYRIVGQKLLLGVWWRSLEQAQQLLAASEARMERGLATKIDIFRAQSQAAAAEGSLFDTQEALQETKDSLKILLNKDLAEEIDVESQIVPSTVTPEEGDLVEKALHNRLDLQEAADQVKDAERNAVVAGRNRYPDLRVGLNYSLTGKGQHFSDSLGFDNSKFSVLFSSSIPLDFAAERAQYQQRQLDLVRKNRDMEDLQKHIAQEIRQALRHLVTVQKRIDIQEKNLQATQAGLDLAKFRFDRGYADSLEVLRAEDSLTQAQKEEITLRIEQVLSALHLRKAAGLLRPFLNTLAEGGTQQTPCPQRTQAGGFPQ